jgi:hypothetical protein
MGEYDKAGFPPLLPPPDLCKSVLFTNVKAGKDFLKYEKNHLDKKT